MSAAVCARQAFRSCTASLSSRAIGRSAQALVHPGRRLAMVSRQYSDDKASPTSSETESNHTPAEPDAVEVSPESDLLAKLKAKEAETVDLKSRLQYLQADFLNLQRNAAREKEQQRDFAITRFAGDLLETADVLGLALASVPQSALAPSETSEDGQLSPATDSASASSSKSSQTHLTELHHGVEMTHRLLLSTLFKYHVKPFDPTGEKFDPNRHEALYQAPIPGKEPGTVLECQKVGYTIKDRLLRAAQVGVVQDES
ncbi:GrpE-domain-containing protein [Hygrophoropsis aurantiaca]|uniref:GrpE-domain-containing protein n=1 Tax=Hygrophoropsis aurantiaca TaxID=72124 RepID=A0ACB8AN19_9AGAM|nr:GrpE-domain-containing protein [Hygrophoropsis aurantiaca]